MRHPVLRLSFGSGNFKEPGYLHVNLMAQLDVLEEQLGVGSRYDTAAERFGHLVRISSARAGQRAIILVDEYDKPILDALDAPEVARANRDFLRGLYAVVKDCDAHIRFSFITGVSKFSKVSLFSGLNNLTDITLEPDYSAICGYTDADLDTVFAPELGGLDRDQVRDWYNGYSWRGADKVYNPFDILLLFDTREFAAHWFETGTPTFLVDTLFKRRVSSLALDGMVSNAALLSTFDVDDMPTEALLFQTGYLTIERPEPRGAEMFYRLGYPNREVRQSLNRSLLNRMTGDASRPVAHSARLYDLLLVNDFTGLAALFESFFASIPYEWYTNNDIASYEGFYASVFYSYFAGLGLDVVVEDSSSHGPAGHGGAFQRQRLPVRAQGSGAGARGRGDRAVESEGLPRSGRADPPDRGGVQQGGPQPGGVRHRAGLTRRSERHDAPHVLFFIEHALRRYGERGHPVVCIHAKHGRSASIRVFSELAGLRVCGNAPAGRPFSWAGLGCCRWAVRQVSGRCLSPLAALTTFVARPGGPTAEVRAGPACSRAIARPLAPNSACP